MATTHAIFKTGKMASKHIDSYLRNVQSASDLDNGSLVILTGLVTGQPDLWVGATPSDVTAQEVFVIDDPVRNLINGSYAIDVVDPREFYVPAGRACRARKLVMGDSCYMSAAAFASAPTVGAYAVPANGAFTLAPAANLTGATLVAFKVIATDVTYVGATTVTGYRLEVVTAV